ncbi:MAG: sodium/solute symporter [Armatimonadota bacterium]
MPPQGQLAISHPDFGAVNYAVIFLYLVGMLVVGGWLSRKIKGTGAFFIAEGKMPAWVVGLSLLGTYLSALTVMALSGIAFGPADWTWTIQLPFLLITAVVITGFVLPRYRNAGVISVYEYLEQRIHVSSRLIAAVCFLALQVGRMGLVLFLPALAFHIITGASLAWTIVVMGLVVTAYTVLGGIEAVIWTDAVQVVIFSVGAVLSIFYIFSGVSSAGADFWALAAEHGKFRVLELGEGLTPREWFTSVLTVWLILETLFQTVRIYGTQQDMTQRYMTTPSTAQANRSVWIAILGYIPLAYLFYFIGSALFVYYQASPDPNIPALMDAGRNDAIFPYFVVTHLPAGIAGLVIAAVFAAAMSSIDSGMNSSATVCVEDFYKRFSRTDKPDEHYLQVARVLTIGLGALATCMALLFMNVASAQIWWSKIMAYTTNGVLGLMALAFLPHPPNRWAAVIGFAASWIALFCMTTFTGIVWLLYPVIGNLVCFVVALLVNAAMPRQGTEAPAGVS